jgi:hypothetical protein
MNEKVYIRYDPQGIEDVQDASTTVVNEISDYIKVYKLILDYLEYKNTTKIIIRNPTVFAWTRKLGKKYGETALEIKEVRPSTLLEERWGFTIPHDVTDEEIIELNLLDLQVEKTPDLTFTDFILSKFVSPIICSATLPYENISKIVEALCKNEIKLQIQKGLVRKEFERKIENWLKGAKEEHEKEIIDLLWQKPNDLKRALGLYAVLAKYPKEVGERAIGSIFRSIKKLELNPSSIVLESVDIDTAINNIEIFLNSEFKKAISETDAMKIIEWASGLELKEFKVISRTLERFPDSLTTRILDSLQKKFSAIQTIIQPEFKKLTLLSKPNRPSNPELTWETMRMLEWLTKEYLPYHFWLEETDKDDNEISRQSELFGDWLFSNFLNLRSSFANMVYRTLPNVMNVCLSDKCILFLVIDNFNYKYTDVLISLFHMQGFRLVQNTPYISMIPTDTEISKKCLFSGHPKASEVSSDYDSLVSTEWPRYFPDKHFVYLRNSLELEKHISSSKDVVFVNCTQIDNVLHQDERKLGKRHSVAIEDELRNLVNLAIGFFNRNLLTSNSQIIICSDHGSTRIPSHVHNEIDIAFFIGKSLEAHHRFITVSKQEFERLPENIKFQCYFLEAAPFGLQENVLIAKGYYRFKRTDEHIFVHGGLSPEETVVPLLIFDGSPATSYNKPRFRLLQNEFRYLTKANIEIEIVNENSAPLEDLRITIISKGVDIVESIPIIQKIDSSSLYRTRFNCRFYRDFDLTRGLSMNFEFKFLGHSYSEKEEFTIQLRSMMESSFKPDQLL